MNDGPSPSISLLFAFSSLFPVANVSLPDPTMA